MRNDLAYIGFIIDRSGSMATLMADAIGGFNTFVEAQKKLPGDALLSLVTFDDKYVLVHDAVALKDVPVLTPEKCFARGSTALFDAVGKLVSSMGANLAAMPEETRPGKVILVITTDGEENCSREYTQQQIKTMLEHQQKKYAWEVHFFAANQDAFAAGARIGVAHRNNHNYAGTARGVQAAYSVMTHSVASSRTGGHDAGIQAALNASLVANQAAIDATNSKP